MPSKDPSSAARAVSSGRGVMTALLALPLLTLAGCAPLDGGMTDAEVFAAKVKCAEMAEKWAADGWKEGWRDHEMILADTTYDLKRTTCVTLELHKEEGEKDWYEINDIVAKKMIAVIWNNDEQDDAKSVKEFYTERKRLFNF